jgi:hypothetical protein
MISKTDKRYLVVSKALPDLFSSNRLKDFDYLPVDYNSLNNGDYSYVLGDDDLTIFNGGLIYPSNSGNAIRNYYGLFKSVNGSSLSQLEFIIDHTGGLGDWLVDSGTTGTIELNNIQLNAMIKRANGQTIDWFNPFAIVDNYGIANIVKSRSGIVTTVGCTLSVFPRVGYGDLVIVRVQASSEWSNKIRNIKLSSNSDRNTLNYI